MHDTYFNDSFQWLGYGYYTAYNALVIHAISPGDIGVKHEPEFIHLQVLLYVYIEHNQMTKISTLIPLANCIMLFEKCGCFVKNDIPRKDVIIPENSLDIFWLPSSSNHFSKHKEMIITDK